VELHGACVVWWRLDGEEAVDANVEAGGRLLRAAYGPAQTCKLNHMEE
jgi:hypothetical protein